MASIFRIPFFGSFCYQTFSTFRGMFQANGGSSLPREINTSYQNLTGKPLFVTVTVQCNAVASNDQAYAELCISSDDVFSPVGYTGQTLGGTGIGVFGAKGVHAGMIVGVIPVNQYYRVTKSIAGTGAVSLLSWAEYY